MKYLLFFLLISCSYIKKQTPADEVLHVPPSINTRSLLGEAHAKQMVAEAIKDSVKIMQGKEILKDQETAIAVAEPILFGIYGKRNIEEEKPYEIYKINGYWWISGTIPKNWEGGGFEIIIRGRDAKVMKLLHYK